MNDYTNISKYILKNIGGKKNINYVTHCATRLRINFNDRKLLNEEKLKTIPGTAGTVFHNEQIQIVFGPRVTEAYQNFLDISNWKEKNENSESAESKKVKSDSQKRNFKFYMNKMGDFIAPVFIPIIPALIVGGIILATKNICVNIFGLSANSGTAKIMLSIFDSAFSFLPVWVGYSLAKQLRMQPIMGGFLGAILINPGINNIKGLDFLGINVPKVQYSSSIFPVILGIVVMYWVDKFLKKVLPQAIIIFMKPILTMIIVVPVTLIILGPIGTELSKYVSDFALWLTKTLGFIAQPILAVIYPYLVMFGLDKTVTPLEIQLIASIGSNPVTGAMGFISNLCIGGTTLALATTEKKDKAKMGIMASSGITALCGVTEPAFYGQLIMRPFALIGTAIGAASGGLIAGIFGLRAFVSGACPGLLTFLYFLNTNGSFYYVYVAIIVAVVSIGVSFIATKILIRNNNSNKKDFHIKKFLSLKKG